MMRRLLLLSALLALFGCGRSSDPISVAVLPADVVASPRTTVQFEAVIDGMVRQDVEWSIRTIDQLDLDFAGSIDADGVYTAPADIPLESQNLIYIRATSAVDPSYFQEAELRVVPVPIYPNRGHTAGNYTVSIEGENFDGSAVPEVWFGDTQSPFVQVTSEVVIQVQVPQSSIGPVDVRIIQSDSKSDTGFRETLYPLGFRYSAANIVLSGTFPLDGLCFFDPERVLSGNIDGPNGTDAIGICSDSEDQVQLVVFGSVFRTQTVTGPVTGWKVGDVNVDGRDDVVLNNGTQITVLLSGAGQGEFWQGFAEIIHVLPAGLFPAEGLEIAQLDADSTPDLAFVMPSLDQAAIVSGLGGGDYDFAGALTVATGSGPRHVAAGDIDGDLADDLVVSVDLAVANTVNPLSPVQGGGVTFLRGDGVGGYTNNGTPLAVPTPVAYAGPVSAGAGEIAVGDVESAPGNEIVVAMPGAETVATLQSDGGVGIQSLSVFGPSPYGGGRLQVDDFDGDGVDDIVSINPNGSVALEIGWGPVTGGGPLSPYELPFAAKDFHLVDFTQNNWDDLVLIGADAPHIQLQLQAFINRSWGPDLLPTPTAGAAGSMAISFLGGATQPSLVVGLPDDGAVAIYSEGASSTLNLDPLTSVTRVHTGDFDDDKLGDLLVVNSGALTTPSLWIAQGGSLGVLSPHEIEPVITGETIERIFDASVIDLDQDGLPDLIVAVGWDLQTPTPSGDLGIVFGSDRWWEEKTIPQRYLTPFGLNFPPTKIVIGEDSLWLLNPLNEAVTAVFGLGIANTVNVALPNPRDLVIYDINEDFVADFLLMAREYSQGQTWTNVFSIASSGNPGEGTYLPATRYRFPGDPHEMGVGDIDADGVTDLFISVASPPSVQVLLGDGAGGFFAPLIYAAGETPQSIVVGDFNGDLIDDVFAADADGAGIRLLYNTSN